MSGNCNELSIKDVRSQGEGFLSSSNILQTGSLQMRTSVLLSQIT